MRRRAHQDEDDDAGTTMIKYLSTRRHTNNLFRLLAATVLLLLQNGDEGYSCDAFSIAAISSASRAGGIITRRRRRRRKHTTTSPKSLPTTTVLRLSPLLSPDHHDLISTLLPAAFTQATSHLWLAAATAPHPPPPSTSSIPILANYVQLLTEYPLSTKVGTAGVLSTLGDAIAQYSTFAKRFEINHQNNNNNKVVVKVVQPISATTSAVETTNDDTNGDTTTTTIPLPPFEYDMKRGVVFCLFGMTYTGAFQHYWFPYLTLHINDWGHNYLHWWGDSGTTTAMMVDDGNSAPPLLFHNGVLYNAPPSPLALAAAKVVVNQVLMIPSLYMPIFLIGFINGHRAGAKFIRTTDSS
jgi:hypothetical protein